MPTLIAPSTALVDNHDAHKLQRESVTGWLVHNDSRRLAPTFHYGPEESHPIVADLLTHNVSLQIGAAITGPRGLALADRLAFAGFVFHDTRRRLPTQTLAVWLSMPIEIDWTMRLYYAAWYSYLTTQSLTGWLAWQDQGIVPATALRRMRDRLLQDAVGVLTRLELVELLKHLDALCAEW
jgi:hypothetical protein